MPSPRILRLAPEYGCWPTWDQDTGDTIDPVDLPIPRDLADRLKHWDDLFQATLDQNYPPDSRFPDHVAEIAWRAEGEAIYAALCDVLGADRVTRHDKL